MIGHVVVLLGFHHRPDLVLSTMATQFHFWHKPHLYNQSCSCLIWFSSQSVPDLIDYDSSISLLAQISLVQLVTSFSYLVFITHYTRSNWSQQFSIVFIIEYTYTIGHIVVLSGFHHKLHWSVGLDNPVSVSTQTRPIRLITSLFGLVFVTDHTQLNQTQQLSFLFGIDHICTIGHVIVLLGFCHRSYPL